MIIQSSAIGVKSQHRDYIANFPRWKKVRDALAANCKSYLRDVGMWRRREKEKKEAARELDK